MSKKKEPPPEDAEKPEGEEGEEGAKKKPPLVILIAAGVGALVILGGGGTAAFFMLSPKPDAHAKNEKPKEAEKPKKEEKKGGKEGKDKGPNPISQGPDGVVYYTLPDLVANIQAADGHPTYLKVKLALELKDESVAESVEPNMPRITDMLQTFMRELRPEDMSGSQGNYELRMEFQRRINLVIAPAKVNSVLIEEMLIN
jgi:flagellar FliL protein